MSTPDIDTLAATAAALRERVDVLHGYVDPEKLRARVDELETAMQADDFWDDPQSASRVSAEHAAVRDRLEEINGIGQEVADLVETSFRLVAPKRLAATLDREG